VSAKRSSAATAVLVLQVGNRSGPWACRSLANAGFRVVGAHDAGRVAGRSRYCRSPLRTPSAVELPDLFLERVEEICRREAIDAVLSNDDEGITQLLATRLPRPSNAVFVGPTADQYSRACDKGNLHETATAAGLDAPISAYPDASGEASVWPPLPSIVKPRTTQTQVAGELIRRSAIVVRTPEERAAAVAEICRTTGGAVVEERIVGTAWRAHFVADGAHLAVVPVTTVRSSPEDAGMSSVQAVTALAPPELIDASRRLLALLEYRGPGSFQFIERAGRFYIHDVNLRLPSSVALTMLAGLDMPRLAVEVALGRPAALDAVRVRTGVRYVWLHGELRTLARRIGARQRLPRIWEIVAEILLAAVSPRRVLDQFVLTDPLPTVALAARAVRALKRPSRRVAQTREDAR
jgi:predicted ATP-grasp superfamily ATP-dependent carboligase